jgi:UPF0755 protein
VKPGWRLPGAGRIILLLWLVLAVAGIGRMASQQIYHGPGPLAANTAVVIPSGSLRAIAARLKAAGAIRHPLLFEAAAWLTRGTAPLRAGEFLIPARSSLHGIIRILQVAPEVEHQVTIPGGLTAIQVAALINAAPDATGSVKPPAEAAILPQTYAYLRGTSRPVILARMERAMRAALASAWAHRAKGLPVRTPADALILASVVQQETPLRAELPKIAAVYENRLAQRMKLQADPTVIFAVTHGAATALPHGIGAADLAVASPYNTYLHHGLPPGPICSPDLAAIKAVLHPAASKALYFVATGKGGHAFAKTFQQQLANIASYRAMKASRDGQAAGVAKR